MAKIIKRTEIVRAEETMPTVENLPAPQPIQDIVGRMAEDFREPLHGKGRGPFKKVTDEEAAALRRRMIRREDGWMGRGRGY